MSGDHGDEENPEAEALQSLYMDATNYEEKIKEISDTSDISKPVGIIDPRHIGYSYLSYMFLESGENLGSAKKIKKENFKDTFQDNALMMGLCLGDYDVIHRRAEPAQYSHAEFTVHAKESPELDFFNSIETYPIFTVGRWHGQRIKGEMTFKRPYDNTFSPLEAEVLVEKVRHPNDEPAEIYETLLTKNSDNNFDTRLDGSKLKYDKDKNNIKNIINKLDEDVLLGTSVFIEPPSDLMGHHVLVGLTVQERDGTSEKNDLPNEDIMDDLMDEYNGWQMPYIVSGVGQSWADILVEMHIDDLDDMNRIADNLRTNVDGVRSTRTYAITKESFNEPVLIDDASKLTEDKSSLEKSS